MTFQNNFYPYYILVSDVNEALVYWEKAQGVAFRPKATVHLDEVFFGKFPGMYKI
ncbi:hypothetical protein M378DRAFT_168453, partial [Amanita muscaria Koide BX008]